MHVARCIEREDSRGGAAGFVARADADDVQEAGRVAERQRIDRLLGAADGAGGALRLALGDDQRAGLQRGGLGHAGRAGLSLDDLGRIDQAIALLVELADGEDAQRHAEMGSRRVERRFIGFDLNGGERRQRLAREILTP